MPKIKEVRSKRQVIKSSSRKSSSRPSMSIRTKVFFVLGFFFLGISLLWYFNQTIQLAFFPPSSASLRTTEGHSSPIPTHIMIPKVGLNLPIEETVITKGVWQISNKGASHLAISARPGEKGPIILYSHNTNERFGPIRWLTIGDTIEITSGNPTSPRLRGAGGKMYKYKVTQTLRVTPERLDVLTKHTEETLVMYTCDGFADLERFVVVAKPI